MFEMTEKLITTVDAAKELGVTPQRVRVLIRAGRLPAQLLGRDYVIRAADLQLVRHRRAGRPKTAITKKRRAA
jgi:excisionase family DNA binding protein